MYIYIYICTCISISHDTYMYIYICIYRIYIYICKYVCCYMSMYMYKLCCPQDLQALTLGGRRREFKVRYDATGNPRPKPQEALRESPQGHGRNFDRQAPEEDKLLAPKAYADARNRASGE